MTDTRTTAGRESAPTPKPISRRRLVVLGGMCGAALAVGGGYVAAEWGPEVEPGDLVRTTMGDGMSKVLVVYGTTTGCTAGVAEQIGATFAELGATVDVVPAAEAPSPDGYDAVAVGSGIRAAQWHAPVKEWVTANAAALKGMPTAFFTACLTMASEPEKADEVRAYTDPIVEESGVQPVDIGLFAGMNEPKTFSLPERLILKVMKAPEGDFRDHEAIAGWARGVAGKLGVS